MTSCDWQQLPGRESMSHKVLETQRLVTLWHTLHQPDPMEWDIAHSLRPCTQVYSRFRTYTQ
jgi:hypothetical protein